METFGHRIENAGGEVRHVIALQREFGGAVADEFHRLALEILSHPGHHIHIGCPQLGHVDLEGFEALLAAPARAEAVQLVLHA